MANWSKPQQLADLEAFYEREIANPSDFDDETFVANVEKAFWATDCWSFIEVAFAIIAPACARRPHLTQQLIRKPIEAMIVGGLENPTDIVAQGVACAIRSDHYVEPTEEGKQWLINVWPTLDSLAQEVFMEVLRELDDED